ncbi:MAG: hypothetical protein P0Y60_11510 [Candidatus Microbacterium colombiense]|nr:MAG: hypothetical protein P0Y60_11510 [Microbacterium sp.]
MTDELELPATRPGPNRRAVLSAAAWAMPVIVATVGTPLAAASGSGVQSASYANVTSETAQGGQITFTRPLSIRITGTMRAGDLVTLTVGGSMALQGGGAGATRATPVRIFSVAGPNFSQASTFSNPDGSQTTVLTVNRDLAEGMYSKTISWIPLDGATTSSMEDEILTWLPGTYTTSISISVGTVVGEIGTLTIVREPEN